MELKTVAGINKYTGNSVNPLEYPEQLYELYSVPSFETGYPEIIRGKEIGSTKITVEEGDVLVCKINPRINRVWVVKHNTEYPLLASSEWIVIRNNEIDSNYLKWYFCSPSFRTLINSQVAGIGGSLTRAQPKQVARYPVPVPCVNEQQKISKILDEVEALISLRREQLAKLDELVKARFVELFGDPVANPFGWRKLTVQQAIDEKIIDKPLDGNHGGKHPKTSDYVPSGIPFIMANNLVEGKVDLENCAFISRKQADSLDKGFAKDGDVLITHKGTIGRTAILHCSYPYIMLTPQVTYYRPKTGIIPEYLKAYFDTDYFQGIIGNIASVGSTRAYIGITAQQELPLIVPPMELQKQFAAFVEQTDKSKLTIQQSLDKLETLKKSLMQKYFG